MNQRSRIGSPALSPQPEGEILAVSIALLMLASDLEVPRKYCLGFLAFGTLGDGSGRSLSPWFALIFGTELWT
jgi:hypothetical protein